MPPLPVATHWYDIEQLDDTLFKIWEPHVIDFMQANMFVVKGTRDCLLIDGGNGVVPLRPFLAEHGLNPTIVVASHAHADHIGALHEWPVTLAHPSEAQGLATLDPDVTLAKPGYSIMDIGTLITDGSGPMGATITALPFAAFTAKDFQLKAPPHVQTIEDGAIIDVGDRRFDVLHVPGHCPGQLAFWDEANKVLIGCDAIYDYKPLDTLHHSDKAVYRTSFERLLKLEPKVTHGGHMGPMGLSRYREVINSYLASPV
jgi:glyoxylase-like metal-dependent hydrolase (beta-lactamase superfamily II)